LSYWKRLQDRGENEGEKYLAGSNSRNNHNKRRGKPSATRGAEQHNPAQRSGDNAYSTSNAAFALALYAFHAPHPLALLSNLHTKTDPRGDLGKRRGA
jgi:hypothetical protein